MMCVRVAPPAHTGEQVRVSPKCGEKLKWGFESPTAPKKKLKKVLTNRKVCDIIKIQKREAWQKLRARPTRVVLDHDDKVLDRTVAPLCGIQM